MEKENRRSKKYTTEAFRRLDMDCQIEYVGKMRNGIPKYWCLTHKALASDKQGNKLDSCFNERKENMQKCLSIEENQVTSIKLVFANILENTVPTIYINDEEFDGVFLYQNWVLDYKDLIGLLLAKINHIFLQQVRCSHCGHYHSDNGKFAYTSHSTHLCLYCGHFFRVKKANIGSELAMIFSIPDVQLQTKKLKIEDTCSITYDLFCGIVLVNGEDIDTVVVKGKEFSLVTFLNNQLKDLY